MVSLRQHATMPVISKHENLLKGDLDGLYAHWDWKCLRELNKKPLDKIISKHHDLWPLLVLIDFVKMFLEKYPMIYDPDANGLERVRHWANTDDLENTSYDDLITLADAVRIPKIRKFLRRAIRICKSYYSNH